MLVLAMESSCDETAAALIRDGRHIVANVVASQAAVHARFGGVVPELASRAHVVNIIPVLEELLAQAKHRLQDIDAVAVTCGPGLIGALLVGLQSAKAIAYARKLPLIGVHHIEGHMSAVYLEDNPPVFPHLALVVSGGHSSLIRVDDHGVVKELAATRDDAAGEAFDKVAKLLGLGYPGGAVIDRLAKQGDPTAVKIPRAMVRQSTDDFSFSGLKTAVLNIVRANGVPTGQALADLCASFQAQVIEVLVRKTRQVAKRENLSAVQVCGGVAANSGLRASLLQAAEEDGFSLHVAKPSLCTDNAAMIGAAGYYRLARGERSEFSLEANPNLPLSGLA